MNLTLAFLCMTKHVETKVYTKYFMEIPLMSKVMLKWIFTCDILYLDFSTLCSIILKRQIIISSSPHKSLSIVKRIIKIIIL